MVFTTNNHTDDWGRVLHDPDLAAAIVDRILERGRVISLDGPSGRTLHLSGGENHPLKPARVSGKLRPDFPEPPLLEEARKQAVDKVQKETQRR